MTGYSNDFQTYCRVCVCLSLSMVECLPSTETTSYMFEILRQGCCMSNVRILMTYGINKMFVLKIDVCSYFTVVIVVMWK